MFVFSINLCALGVRTIIAVTADKVVIGGGDGQVVMLHTNHKDTAPI